MSGSQSNLVLKFPFMVSFSFNISYNYVEISHINLFFLCFLYVILVVKSFIFIGQLRFLPISVNNDALLFFFHVENVLHFIFKQVWHIWEEDPKSKKHPNIVHFVIGGSYYHLSLLIFAIVQVPLNVCEWFKEY